MITVENLRKIIIGFRYEKCFKITDSIGTLQDDILRDPASPFRDSFFPKYSSYGDEGRILINPETEASLIIHPSDTIFQYSIEEGKIEEELKWFKEDAVSYIVDRILGENHIRSITRVGIMYVHKVNSSRLAENIIKKISDGSVEAGDQFILTYGKKDSTVDATLKKGVNDFLNKITIVKQLSKDEYEMTLDYQYYFLPYHDGIDNSKWDWKRFIDISKTYLTVKYYPAINRVLESDKK
jgi:hypothetical protein